MSNEVVAREVAEAEFARWLDAMCLRFDIESMDAEDRTNYQTALEIIISAIQDGRLTVNDNGEFVYSPMASEGGPITFHEPTGASLMAMDQQKKGHEVAKGFSTMADITKTPIARYSKMPNRDLRVCQNITMLFLRST